MTNEIMIIFTAKTVEDCLEAGGTQSWVLDRAHAKRCKYAVLCRNTNTDWGDGKEPHGTAFMIGRICDVVPSTEWDDDDGKRRWLVKFDEYARLNMANFWKGWRNPIRYTTLEELSLILDDVQFEPMPEIVETSEIGEPKQPQLSGGLTIADAKKGLAIAFGIKPTAVEIIIHG